MSNTAFNSNFVSTGGSSPATQEFRLTLTSNTPVLTTGVTGATTLYLTPYKGNKIGLYSAGAWSVVSSSEVSLSLAALSSANTNYDIFAYLSGVTVVLEALAWTNSGAGTSARATALAYQDGILVKSGDATRRYIGTIRTVAAGQTEFSFGAIGNTSAMEAKLFVWNYYNRIQFSSFVADNTASWTYSPGAWRAANNNSAFRVSFVVGVKESAVNAFYLAYTAGSSSIAFRISLGVDSVSAPHTNAVLGLTNYAQFSTPMAKMSVIPSEGFHFVSAIENVVGGSATSYGYSTSQTGMTVLAFC